MDPKQPTIISLGLEALRRLFADEAIPLAGNIAFRTLFSIFPFLIFLTALAGFFGNADLAEKVVSFLLSVAPEQLVHPLASEIRSILTVPRTGLLSIAALLTIWSAMGGVDSIRVGLNRAYDQKENRNLFWLYGQSVLFVIGSAIGLLAIALLIVIAPVALAVLDRFAPEARHDFAILNQLRYPIAVAILVGGLQLCHRILPAKRLKKLGCPAGGSAHRHRVDCACQRLLRLSRELQFFCLHLCLALRPLRRDVFSLPRGPGVDPRRRSEPCLASPPHLAFNYQRRPRQQGC